MSRRRGSHFGYRLKQLVLCTFLGRLQYSVLEASSDCSPSWTTLISTRARLYDGKRYVQWRIEDNVNDILNFIW